jgi:alpha-tubulin suppressor-like RCC1 family protein
MVPWLRYCLVPIVVGLLIACDDEDDGSSNPGTGSGLDGGSGGHTDGGDHRLDGGAPPEGGAATNPSACVTAVAAGGSFSCALTVDKKTICWGQNNQGQVSPAPALDTLAIGFGQLNGCGVAVQRATCWGSSITQVKDEIPNILVKEVSMGVGPVCAVALDGRIVCWGSGGLCLSAQCETAPDGPFVHVTTGGSHACGLRENGTAVCFGGNEKGELNVPDTTFAQIDAAQDHTCGVTTAGNIVCWGDPTFKRLDAPGGTFKSVSAGRSSGCGIRTDGTIACWGEDGIGKSSPPPGKFTSLDASNTGDHACAVTEDKSVVCWGSSDAQKQLSGAPGPCGR